LRIAQIVTLVTPNGAYGGPVRVAVNQAKALIAQGHEVTIFAGTRGFTQAPIEIEGVPVRLFTTLQAIPKAGFAGVTSLGLLRAVTRASKNYDVWHIHLARDLITLPAAAMLRFLRIPFLVQCHGMIDESKKLLSKPLDAALTRRILRSATAVLTLTPREETDLQLVAGTKLATDRIPNGVPDAVRERVPASGVREVLFLARLQARKRPQHFVRAAIALAAQFPEVRFTLVGPDEGEGKEVEALISGSGVEEQITWVGSLQPAQTLDRMMESTLYVLPSVDEPFPMSVLEALSIGLPVIITDSCGLATYVRDADAGLVVDANLESLTNAIESLLRNPTRAVEMGANGRDLVLSSFSMDTVASILMGHYRAAQTCLPPHR
jgi:glycosyltransferase involved in cell wall biosynthesis